MIYHISYIRLPIIFWYFYKNCKPCGLQIYSNFCRLSYHPNCLPTQWKHFLQSRFQGAHRCSWDVEIYIDDNLVGQLNSFQGVKLVNGGFKELRNIFITWQKHLLDHSSITFTCIHIKICVTYQYLDTPFYNILDTQPKPIWTFKIRAILSRKYGRNTGILDRY